MKVYEVNFNKMSDWIPFDMSNTSEYVQAESVQEATQIAMKLLGIKKKDICFVAPIKTIN